MYVRRISEEGNRPFGMLDSIEEFTKFGEGIYFYFCFLKYFGFLFFLMSLCVIPTMVLTSNWDSSGLEGDSNYLVKTSLGNLKEMEYDWEASYEEIEREANLFEKEMRLHYYIFEALDLTYSVILLVGIIVFKIIIFKKRQKIEKETMTVRKYSLMVSKLPPNATLDQTREFFETFGKVIHVNGIFDFCGALKKVKELAKAEIKKAANIAKLDKSKEKKLKKRMKKIRVLDKKIEKLNSQIRRRLNIGDDMPLNLSKFDGFRLMQVFVTFEDHKKRQEILESFEEEYRKGICKCLKKVERNEKYYMQGHTLEVKQPDLPSNINWENIGYSIGKRVLRIFLLFIFIVILLAIGTVLILVFTSLRESKKETMRFMNSDCFEERSIAEFLGMSEHDGESTFCFCNRQNKFTIINNSDVRQYCYDYLQEVIMLTVMRFLASFLITVVDILFAFFINKIIRFVSFYTFLIKASNGKQKSRGFLSSHNPYMDHLL